MQNTDVPDDRHSVNDSSLTLILDDEYTRIPSEVADTQNDPIPEEGQTLDDGPTYGDRDDRDIPDDNGDFDNAIRPLKKRKTKPGDSWVWLHATKVYIETQILLGIMRKL
jgi:hypothetical protein